MRSPRLTYRELRPNDAARITDLAGDWDVARMTARIPYPYSVPQACEWIGSLEPDEVVRVIELDGELIGAVGYNSAADGTVEFGYWIGRPWWGRGYATEAAETLVRHCFDTIGVPRLTCCHFVDNPASQRIITKLGFKLIGPCETWCEARRSTIATLRYFKKRPFMSRIRRRAA